MTDTSATRPVPSTTPPTDSAGPPAPAATPDTPPAAPPARNPLRRTRTGVTWVGVIVFAAVLVLLLIFILQNTQAVQISYLGASGHVSLAVAMLLAAVAGVLLTAIAGSLRIWQLRRHLRRSTRRGT
ncbi:putative integral membrane protein [Tamaricihabitans halophyticus]|uniref:Putative integral membrane protein n=1 Tax=Tamaricihabitans halophyticus TaxID=1262583 RepID=A0A4R2QA22_9PSEU|nr:lipopolysaccharide assembly protein LapA domain-containing protein [Tamaricihabitans halophyticus]TCP43671.1 putative integral membrane protein [Tamaricihabitans halophyticus]